MGENTNPDDLTRRRLLAGLGAGAAVGLTGAASVLGAAPASGQEHQAADPRTGRASPVTSTLASAPEAGVSYVFRSWMDFVPESGASYRAFGGRGAYSAGTGLPYLWTSIDLPIGAVVRDIEWYAYNGTGANMTMLARLWSAGTGPLFSTVADTVFGPSATDVTRVRTVVPTSSNGPHPHGSRMVLGGNFGGPTQQINGVRVGFVVGPSALAPLAVPVRVYDSRPGTTPAVGVKAPLAPGEERVLDLKVNGSKVPAGASAVLVTILLTNAAAGNGNLTMWRNGAAKPQANTLVWGPTGGRAAITAVTTVDQLARCRISASLGTHVVVDVVGFYS